MIEELRRIDNIARYYFLVSSIIFMSIAASVFTEAGSDAQWFGIICLGLSFFQFFIGIGLSQRKKWGLTLARCYVSIFHRQGFPFRTTPFLTEWLANIKDRQLDQFFR